MLEKVVKYRCSECGKLFDVPSYALEHEARHEKIHRANEMLKDGHTLQEIADKCEIFFDKIPEYLQNVTKDNCFKIPWLQCCDKPAYQIVGIDFDGKLRVQGFGSWRGYYYNDSFSIRNNVFKNPRPKEELFIDKTYKYGC